MHIYMEDCFCLMALVVTKKVVVLIWCPEMNISKGKLPIFCWKTVSGVWISRRFEYYDLSHISCITLWNTWLNFNFDPNSSSCTYVLLVLNYLGKYSFLFTCGKFWRPSGEFGRAMVDSYLRLAKIPSWGRYRRVVPDTRDHFINGALGLLF